MKYSCSTILLLVCIIVSKEYVNACDDDCRAVIMQEFRNILKEELNPIKEQLKPMDEIKNGILNLTERLNLINLQLEPISQIEADIKLVDRAVGDTLDEVGKVLELSEEIIGYAKSLEAKQDSMLNELQSVKAQVESHEASFNELKSLSLNTSQPIQQTTDSLNNTVLQFSQNSIDVKEQIHDLKTFVNESNELLDEIKEGLILCIGPPNASVPHTNAQVEKITKLLKDMDTNRIKSDNIILNSVIMTRQDHNTVDVATKFKLFNDEPRTWADAKMKCEEEGYILAEPLDDEAELLRTQLVQQYGDIYYVWLGNQGDGSRYMWQHSGRVLSESSSLWGNGRPDRSPEADNCVTIYVEQSYLSIHPGQPYDPIICYTTAYTLCEVKPIR